MFGEETITIDVDKLRDDMKSECMGAFFGGGFGAALIEAGDIECATPRELVDMAQRQGVNLRNYQV